MSRQKIAFYGGSFNPPHIGHQMTALQVLSLLPVDALCVAPAFEHAEGKQLAPFEQRIEMANRTVRPLRGSYKSIFVSRVEEDACKAGSKGRTSETLKMVRKIHGAYENAQIVLVLGSDLKERIANWSGFSDLADMIKVGDVSLFFAERWLDVSSTKVRELYAQGADLSRLVPEDVNWYINHLGLYR